MARRCPEQVTLRKLPFATRVTAFIAKLTHYHVCEGRRSTMTRRDKPDVPNLLRKLFFDTNLASPQVIAAEVIWSLDVQRSREEDDEEEDGEDR